MSALLHGMKTSVVLLLNKLKLFKLFALTEIKVTQNDLKI